VVATGEVEMRIGGLCSIAVWVVAASPLYNDEGAGAATRIVGLSHFTHGDRFRPETDEISPLTVQLLELSD
jgi:hypothetical protein